ncbi:MAG: N4-gp56 family major capsid protein [Pseudomonadota bacterium]
MATNTSTSSGLSNRTNLYAERELLKNQAPVVVLDKFGMQKQMPKNKTTTIKFRRAIPFTAETIPLQEGVTPSNTPFAYEDVEGTLEQYGQVSDITDVIEDTNEDAVLNDMVVELGQNIGRTREALCWAAFRAGTNVFFANGTARNQVNTPRAEEYQAWVADLLGAGEGGMVDGGGGEALALER